ncbi:MAG: SRPBCC family protein [Actinomycetota bacterium]|nr:SRPBCC family protein [Actinomycetota bacterium]
MELNNDFRVGVDRDTTWNVLTDLERIAPLLPGAQLQEVEGDEYRGIVKVKVGPIQAQYKGTATLVETDQSAGKMVMKASGRDTRGQGNASATITLTMTADGDGTKVSANTDLTISGKVAQFGRGVLADVSSKLIGQFVDNLEADLNSGGQEVAAHPGASSPGPDDEVPDQAAAEALVGKAERAETNGSTGSSETASGPVGPGTTAPTTTGTTSTSGGITAAASDRPSGPRKIQSAEPQPVDLFDAAGNTVVKRVAPLVGALLLILLALLLRRRRKTTASAKAAARVNAALSSLPDTDALVGAGRKARKQAAKHGRKAGKVAAAQGLKAGKQAAVRGREAKKQAAVQGSRATKQAAVHGRKAAKRGRQAATSAGHVARGASRQATKRGQKAAVEAQKRSRRVGSPAPAG